MPFYSIRGIGVDLDKFVSARVVERRYDYVIEVETTRSSCLPMNKFTKSLSCSYGPKAEEELSSLLKAVNEHRRVSNGYQVKADELYHTERLPNIHTLVYDKK
jgi:hypothetical protein